MERTPAHLLPGWRHLFWPTRSCVGPLLLFRRGQRPPDIEIVGVVRDARHTNIREEIRRAVFTPYLQDPELGVVYRFGLTFYVRTWQDPKAAESAIRSAMRALNSKLVLDAFRTMQEQVDENFSDERIIAFLASSFGVLAAFLAAIGIYGVLAYSTAQRTREIGVRTAMGATRTEVIRIVLLELVWLIAAGIATGVPLSLLRARAIRDQLFGVSSHDVPTIAAVCLMIAAVAFASSALPAHNATKIDPMVALRYE